MDVLNKILNKDTQKDAATCGVSVVIRAGNDFIKRKPRKQVQGFGFLQLHFNYAAGVVGFVAGAAEVAGIHSSG
jgi:hypothetical protein